MVIDDESLIRKKYFIMKRDNYTCKICGVTEYQLRDKFINNEIKNSNFPKLHVDHIIPLGLNGPDNLDNLQTLCVMCHIKKTTNDRKEIFKMWKTKLTKEQIINIIEKNKHVFYADEEFAYVFSEEINEWIKNNMRKELEGKR